MAKHRDLLDISHINRLKDLDAAKAFIDILSKHGIHSLNNCIWLAACYSLAARKIHPDNLDSTSLSTIKSLASDSIPDKSPLALSIGHYLNELQAQSKQTTLLDFKIALSRDFFHCSLAAWVFQILTQSGNKTTYTQARQSRSFDELPRLTQWFTPSWVSSFLADQVVSKETRTFLDPACGGGHILVEVLKSFCAKAKLSASKALERIWGLDIEPGLIKLSALSLYLCALDINNSKPDPDLPVAHLYYLDSLDQELGSLLLGIKGQNFSLIGYDNTRFDSTKLPLNFDAIAANPPYLGYRLLPKKMVAFLRSKYKDAHYDLYSAFLDLATRLIEPDGKISFICQQSFLNITRYEAFRKKLLAQFNFTSIVSLGSGAFQSRSGEKVSSVIVTLEHSKKEYQVSHIDLRESSTKRKAIKNSLGSISAQSIQGKEMEEISQLITGTPILPDCPLDIAKLFSNLPKLDDNTHGITVTNGLFTCDNKRFVKHVNEIRNFEIDDYVPYDKGGGQKWFASTPYRLWWKDQGESIRNLRVKRGQSKTLPGEDFYFQTGITYSYIGTRGFKARLLSPNSVFDIASSSLFCKDESELNYLLGFLNSSLVIFILGQLNPTVNFQIGDIRRIPYKKPSRELKAKMTALVEASIDLAKRFERLEQEIGPEQTFERIQTFVDELNSKEKLFQEQIDQIIFTLYSIPKITQKQIMENYWVKNSRVFLAPPKPTFKTALSSAKLSLV